MTGPFPFAREAISLDDMLASIGGAGWDGLAARVKPALPPDSFKPDDRLLRFCAGLYGTAEGREFFDWLADLTLRAPPGASGNTLESAALAHAKHESRFAVGQAIFLAIVQGRELLNQKEPQT